MVTNGKSGFSVGSGVTSEPLEKGSRGQQLQCVHVQESYIHSKAEGSIIVASLALYTWAMPTWSSPRSAPHTLPLLVLVSITTAVMKHHHQKQLGQERVYFAHSPR